MVSARFSGGEVERGRSWEFFPRRSDCKAVCLPALLWHPLPVPAPVLPLKSSRAPERTGCPLLQRKRPRPWQWRPSPGRHGAPHCLRPPIRSSLRRFTYGHAGTIYKDFVYISGGHDYQIGPYRKNLLCYDHRTDVWEERRPMTTARGWHSMCSLEDRIYCIGGSDDSVESMERFDVLGVEAYSPQCNQWTRVAPLLHANSESGVAVWQGRIYILGGYSWENTAFSKTVQVYDREKDKWSKGTDLPKAIAGVSACVCALKPRLEDKKKKGKAKRHQDRGQ